MGSISPYWGVARGDFHDGKKTWDFFSPETADRAAPPSQRRPWMGKTHPKQGFAPKRSQNLLVEKR